MFSFSCTLSTQKLILQLDPEVPTLKIDVGEDSRNTLWGKTKKAFQYIYENYR